MALRCKPGDWAEIILTGEETKHLLGQRVKITGRSMPTMNLQSMPAWYYEPPLLRYANGVTEVRAIHDFCLRPLRENGPDPADLRIPLPRTEKEPA